MKIENNKNYGFWAFLPLFIFLAIYIGSGIYFAKEGVSGPFKKFPRQVALLIAIASAFLMGRKITLDKKLEIFSENAGSSGVILIGIIYLLAGAFQETAKLTGGVDSIVNLGLTFIPSKFLIPGVFLISSGISTAIGTSTGTIATMAPIALGVAQATNLNVPMMASAVIGGAYFGDNLSMISDTTIAAARGVGSNMKDKFRMNFLIALPAAIVATFLYWYFSGKGIIPQIGSYSIIRVIPYLTVLFSAILGFNVVAVLFIGILMTGIIGIGEGTITFFQWIDAIGKGMAGVFNITIIAILISGLIGLIKYYGGIQWLVNILTRKVNQKKDAEYGLSFMAGILSTALVNNTVAIIITAPIAKEIGEKYKIAPKRIASLIDIFACGFLALTPYDSGMLIITGLGNISSIEVLKYSFYIFALLITALLTIYLRKNKKGY